MIRLLVCDDSPEARAALRTMFAGHGEIEVVGEACNGSEAVSAAAALSPDVVLMDVSMPLLDGVGATERIRRLVPTARIVALAGSSERETVAAMLEAGASAYCVKGVPLWELERAIAGASEPLVRLAHALARPAGPGSAGELVARELSELSGGATVAVYLAASDVGLSLAGLAGGGCRARMAAAPSVAVRAFREGTASWARAEDRSELAGLDAPCVEAVAVPLVSDGEALGSLLAGMPPGIDLVIDLELVSAVADLTSASLATMRRLMLTHAEARRDALTGLANRRAFDERLDDLLGRGRQVGIALIDIDDFKQVNDRDGHEAGDAVLREVARVALRKLRADEEVYRIGGEELAIVMEGSPETAADVATRLRLGLLGHARPRSLPTVSVGVAGCPDHGTTKRELLRAADTALYRAKRTGKNRVVVFRLDVDEAWSDRGPARSLGTGTALGSPGFDLHSTVDTKASR